MAQIAPSILAADFLQLGAQVRALAAADWLHIDIMDGHFVPNISFGPEITRQIRQATDVPLDVHLMLSDPAAYVDAFVEAGARCISVHAEACIHLDRTVAAIKERGVEASVALNPATPLEAVRWVLADVDQVLLMTVNPGFGGQAFIGRMVDKIRELKAWRARGDYTFRIQADGGINAATLPAIVAAGADVLVVGSALFQSDNLAAALSDFQRLSRESR